VLLEPLGSKTVKLVNVDGSGFVFYLTSKTLLPLNFEYP